MKKRLAVLTLALSAAMMLNFGAFAEEETITGAVAEEVVEETAEAPAEETEETAETPAEETEETAETPAAAEKHEYSSEPQTVVHDEKACTVGEPIEVIKKPTCTESGLEMYECKYNKGQYHYVVTDPLGHTWSSSVKKVNWGRITTEPTCQQEGYAEDYCTVCGAVNPDRSPRQIEKTAHRFEKRVVDTPVTCAVDGKAHKVCIYCGTPETYKDGEHKGEIIYEITKAYDDYHYKEHPELWTNWAQEKAPTCWTEGREWRACTLCGDKEYRTIPKLKANYVEFSQRLIDCYTREITYKCSICQGKEDKKLGIAHKDITVPYPVKSHVFKLDKDYVIEDEDVKPKCTEDGKKVYKCVYYDNNPQQHKTDKTATKTVIIPATGHKWGKWIQHHVPSEASDGYGTWARKCSVCGQVEEKLSKNDPSETKPAEGKEDKKNGFVKDEDGKIRLYKDGEVRKDVTNVVSYNDGIFFITEGVIDDGANGLNLYEGTWYFLADGQVQNQYSGFAEYDNNWFMIENGMLNENANGLYEYNGGTFMFAAGKLRTDVSGLWQNSDGKWYYLANGQVQTQHTGVVQYDGAFFYVVNGQLATDYNGTVDYDGKTFKVVAGQLY